MRRRGGMPIAAGLAALAAWGVLCAPGCRKDDSAGPGNHAENGTIKWRKADFTAGGRTVSLEVGRYDRPIRPKPLPLARTRRDTPLNTWISLMSHEMAGKDADDLKACADHYTEPGEFLSRQRATTQQFFDEARKADESAAIVGMIRYDRYTVVVTSVRHTWWGTCMVERGGRYYIDEKAKFADPVLMELTATGYSLLKEPR